MTDRRMILLATQCLATMPVWIWYADRITHGVDEPFGVLAFATGIFFVASRVRSTTRASTCAESSGASRYVVPSAFLFLYAVTYSQTSPQVQSVFVLSALVATVSEFYLGKRFDLGLWGLAMLSLPLVGSLEFYFAYPLRVAAGTIAVPLLQFAGYAVELRGTGLVCANDTVWIDAPCSGIQMLWAGGYLTSTLCCFTNLGAIRTALAGAAALAIVVFGNALRASSLFFTETGRIPAPPWAHDAIGIVVFAATGFCLVSTVHWLGRSRISAHAT